MPGERKERQDFNSSQLKRLNEETTSFQRPVAFAMRSPSLMC